MYCTNCGDKLKENARFCGHCGSPVELIIPRTAVQTVQNNGQIMDQFISQPVLEPQEAPAVRENDSKVTLILSILSIAMGALGIFWAFFLPGGVYITTIIGFATIVLAFTLIFSCKSGVLAKIGAIAGIGCVALTVFSIFML